MFDIFAGICDTYYIWTPELQSILHNLQTFVQTYPHLKQSQTTTTDLSITKL